MAVFEVSTDLIQKIDNDLYKINLSSVAKQIAMLAEDGTTKSTVQAEIEKLRTLVGSVSDAVDGSAKIYVKEDIAGRDTITDQTSGAICYVKDASADDTVEKGAASYLWDGTKWDKLTEFESLDLVLDWADITNKPEYTDSEGNTITIQDALEKAHTHENKTVLDKFSESADGKLEYNGNKVGVDNGAVFSIKVTGDNPDYAGEIAKLGDVPNNSAVLVMRETPVSTRQATRAKSFALKTVSK